MNREYKATYDYLFDKEENLFYRDWRYFDKREANGKKVFWDVATVGCLVVWLKY